MPFRLKNVGATYQRLVSRMFEKQICRNMDVYIDNMLVKSLIAEQHIIDLNEAFEILIKYQIKLNITKCAFSVSSGKFLIFMITE